MVTRGRRVNYTDEADEADDENYTPSQPKKSRAPRAPRAPRTRKQKSQTTAPMELDDPRAHTRVGPKAIKYHKGRKTMKRKTELERGGVSEALEKYARDPRSVLFTHKRKGLPHRLLPRNFYGEKVPSRPFVNLPPLSFPGKKTRKVTNWEKNTAMSPRTAKYYSNLKRELDIGIRRSTESNEGGNGGWGGTDRY